MFYFDSVENIRVGTIDLIKNMLKPNKTRVAHGKHWQCGHADFIDLKFSSGCRRTKRE